MLHDTKKVIAVGKGRTWSETSDTREGDATILSFIASPINDNTSRLYAFMARNHSIDKPDSSFAEGFDTLTEQDRVVVESQRPEQIPADISAELHLRYPDAASVLYRRLLREVPMPRLTSLEARRAPAVAIDIVPISRLTRPVGRYKSPAA